MTSSTDQIVKEIVIKAPQEKVWRAISNAREFGEWFGVEFDGEFAPGKPISGRITPTKVDPAVAEIQKSHAGFPFTIVVDRIDPMHTFSYRWHPFAIDPDVDYSKESMTLVTFALEPSNGGTKLRLTESGFDSIPLDRRADAFEANEEGWTMQMQLVEKYLLLPQS